MKRTRFNLSNQTLNVTGGASTAAGFGSTTLGGLPEGNILLLGALAYVRFNSADADVIAAWDGDFSVGTTATADATLSGTDANIIAITSTGAATAKLSPQLRASNVTAAVIDNTDKTAVVTLNLITDDNSVTDSLVGTFTVAGYVEIVYAVLGDD
jgi:hypothetical protein